MGDVAENLEVIGISNLDTSRESNEVETQTSQENVEPSGVDEVIYSITPTKPPKGLSFDDYLKNWSRKKIKKEMSAVRIALASKRKMQPP